MGVGVVRLATPSKTPNARAVSAGERLGELGSEWVRLDEAVLVWGQTEGAARSAGLRVDAPTEEPPLENLRLVTQVGRVFERKHPDVRVVLDKGRHLVVALGGEQARRIERADDVCYRVRPLVTGETVFRTVVPPAGTPEAGTEALVNEVSQRSFEEYLTRLADFPTRHSLSADFETAAAWVRAELERLGFAVEAMPISVESSTSLNMIADQPGHGLDSRGLVIVCAHLDSINVDGGPSAPAPGADDNGSGAAALLEIGRVLAGHRAAHDLRLILFGGEEQGLYGSRQYVEALPGSERSRVRAVINMDMVATLNTPERTVLIEGAGVSQELMDELAAAAATYTGLVVQTSLDPFNSDHVPFIDAGMPAVLTIEGADRGNGNVHTAGDTLDHIDYGLAVEIMRMNVASSAAALGSG
ncbi:MAG: M28 family metallopeptidase [Actinomycetota bacterium]|nr:M28 family metallopeptidase [Actinomycetota bacterium]